MNAHHSFSRRFFAEFIATRINAWRHQGAEPGSPDWSAADRPTGTGRGVGRPAAYEVRRDASGRDVRRPVLPGQADPRQSRNLEIG